MFLLKKPGFVVLALTAFIIIGFGFNSAMGAEKVEKSSDAQKNVAEATVDKMGVKLARGVVNVATGWLEVPRQITRSASDDGPFLMLPLGLARGTFMTVVRTTYGVLETAFFYMPFGDGYNSVLKPAYVWQSEDDE